MNDVKPPTLVSVHVPKSSGISLRTALVKAVGAERVRLDYADDPVDPLSPRPVALEPSSANVEPASGVRVIHGHFAIRKYDQLDGCLRAVMLREPVDNLISIYFFWNHLIDSGHRDGHELFRSFVAERPTILDFARVPTFRYLLSQTFFADYPMDRFDIIGNFTERKRYFNALSRLLDVRLDVSVHDNRTPRSRARRQTARDGRVIRELRDLLRDDIRFYERWAGRHTA